MYDWSTGVGTEVHSMGDVNEDSNSSSWPLFYGEKTLTNGHHCNGFIPRTITDANTGCDKDVLKQKMLEHEIIFKNQVPKVGILTRFKSF